MKILISVLIIAIAVFLPHSGLIPLPFVYSIPVFLIIWLFLKYSGENFSNLGFRLKSLNLKSVLIGISVGAVLVAFSQLILFPLLDHLMDLNDPDVEMYDRLKGNTGFFIFLLIMSWLIGGLYEEIVFHGFIFTQIEKFIPGKYATLLGFLLTSIIFGLYHLQLGTADTINALLIGASYHALILFNKRNIWYGIICHATYDTIVITLLYLDLL